MARWPAWISWAIISLIGLFIVIANDVLGDNDAFLVFGLCYSVFLAVFIVRYIFKQIKSSLLMKKDLARMEMLQLKSQVNPHFFFNTLNNLYGLVDKDPKKAQQLILDLSDLMRYSIYEGEKAAVMLTDELDYLKNYINVQKDRYHKEVMIDYQENIDDQSYQIMPLLLIILVENAFKHGVEKMTKDSFVKINLEAKDGQLAFTIENNYDQEEKTSNEKGIGLSNLKRRLEIGYPNAFQFTTLDKNGIYKAYLSLQKL